MDFLITDIETGINKNATLFLPEKLQYPPSAKEPVHKAPKSFVDPVKIKERIKENKAKWKADYLEKTKKFKIEYNKWEAKCPLDALTGEVLAIGYKHGHEGNIVLHYQKEKITEKDLLLKFWKYFTTIVKKEGTIIGHNLKSFDMPFLWKRSTLYGIRPPWFPLGKDKWGLSLKDTMENFGCGTYPKVFVSLNNLLKFYGFKPKIEDGKYFQDIFKVDVDRALEYLHTDIEGTYNIAKAQAMLPMTQEEVDKNQRPKKIYD